MPYHPDRGVAPTPSMASDNTLGSFSPYQGRLYMTYTGGGTAAPDVFMIFSDNGGAAWTVPGSGSVPITLANAVSMATSAANDCQGASFTVYLRAAA